LQALLGLAAVGVLAWVVLRWSAQRGLGLGAGHRVQVLERVPLDARRWIYLVQIGERVLVVGAGDGASPTLLAELPARELPDAPRHKNFLDVLRTREAPAETGPKEARPESGPAKASLAAPTPPRGTPNSTDAD